MPRRTLLTDAQRAALLAIPTDETTLIQHYTLSDEDRRLITRRRRPASMPMVLFQMPPDPGGQRFYAVLLAAIGGPTSVPVPIAQIEHLTMTILRRIGAKLLVIDEVHNLLTGNTTRQRELLGLLRFLGNELRLPLICVGTKDAYLAIRTDEQLENRFEPLLLPVWQDDDEFGRLLASFEAVLPLREPSGLATPPLRRRILERSEGVLGEVAALLRERRG